MYCLQCYCKVLLTTHIARVNVISIPLDFHWNESYHITIDAIISNGEDFKSKYLKP